MYKEVIASSTIDAHYILMLNIFYYIYGYESSVLCWQQGMGEQTVHNSLKSKCFTLKTAQMHNGMVYFALQSLSVLHCCHFCVTEPKGTGLAIQVQ